MGACKSIIKQHLKQMTSNNKPEEKKQQPDLKELDERPEFNEFAENPGFKQSIQSQLNHYSGGGSSKITNLSSLTNNIAETSKKMNMLFTNESLKQKSKVVSFKRKSISNMDTNSIQNEFLQNSWLSSNFEKHSIKQIGAGGFGCVFSATSLKTNGEIAIKVLKVSPKDDMKQMMNEVMIMISLNGCSNIIRIDDLFADTVKRQVLFAMELGKSSLGDLIQRANGNISCHLILQIIMDCINGLEYASNRGFAHMDIKPENIIYFDGISRKNYPDLQKNAVEDDNKIFKLSDWGGGLLRASMTTEVDTCYSYSPGYAAPEIINDDIELFNPSKVDIFAFGMTLLYCCGVPLKNFRHLSVLTDAKKYERDLNEIIDSLDPSYCKLKLILTKMLSYNPEERIGLASLQKLMKFVIEGGSITDYDNVRF